MTVSSKSIIAALAFAILTLNVTSSKVFCMDNEEENQPTRADSIAPQNLTELNNRSYDEGITVNEIEITGNHLVKSEDILTKISVKKGAKFDKDLIKKDLKTIYDMGYFTDKLKAVPEMSSDGIKLRIEVEENVPVTGFNITGNKVISTEDLSKIFNSQTGLPQNIAELNKAIEKIEGLYSEKGYVLARVNKITDDPDGMINIDINEGIIDSIKITGNTKTKDFVIKRNMLMAPGTVYNENLLKQDMSRIFSTQAFSDIRRVITASPTNPDNYQLTVEVDEKRTGSISLGGGVDTATGLFGSAGYVDNNFRGLGQQVSLNFLAGSGSSIAVRDIDTLRRASFQFEANFVEPRLKQTLNSLELKAFGSEYASYQVPRSIERRIGGEIEIGRPIKKVPHLAASVSLGIEGVSMKEGDEAGLKARYKRYINPIGTDAVINRDFGIARRAQLEGGTFISLGPTLVFDTRNSLLNPTKGWYATTSIKESFGVAGDVGTFGRVTGSIKRYIPIGEKSTFSISGKAGSQLVTTLPDFAAFRLGGSYTIRGFKEGNVGNGPSFVMASAEFATPIPFIEKLTKINFFRDIRLAGFMDAGTLFKYKDDLTNRLYNRPGYAISIGGGLRVNIPGLGPIRVDYGYPLTFVGSGNNKTGRFTFGFGDRY